MGIGPVEYLIISFPGDAVSDDIAPALAALVESDTVRILDLVIVKKDADGTPSSFEFGDLPELAAIAEISGDADGLLSDDDVDAVADLLDPGSSALFILWEDRWATDLAVAIRGAGGRIVAGERIPHDVIEAAVDAVESALGQGGSA